MAILPKQVGKLLAVGVWRLIRLISGHSPKRITIIPPSDGGSLGDQAMVDAVCRYCADTLGMEVIVMSRPGREIVVRTAVLHVDFNIRVLIRNIRLLLKVLRSSHMVFLGADVIDGIYSGDARRLGRLDLASRAGVSCGILGFSFSETPAQKAIARLRTIADMPMHVRDPVSLDRFERATGRTGTLVADLAFLMHPEPTSPGALSGLAWIASRRALGDTVLAVNMGGPGLWKGGTATLPQIREGLVAWMAEDPRRSIVFVPHDFRPGKAGDQEAINAIVSEFQGDMRNRIHVLQSPYNAWDAKAVAGAVDFAVTARMHFAIACLGMGVPALCMPYQGKFEGMLRHFELDQVFLVPDKAIKEQLCDFEKRLPELRVAITNRLPEVRKRSERNFSWMQVSDPVK